MADPWAAFPTIGGGAPAAGPAAAEDPWSRFPATAATPAPAAPKPAEPTPAKVSENYGFTDYAIGSLPFGEEVQAAGGSLGRYLAAKLAGKPASLSDAYTEKLAELRADHAGYADNNPAKAIAGDVAGGFAFAPAKGMQLAQTAMGAIGQGAKQGAIIGGAYGAGSEGDLYGRGVEMLKGAGVGGAIGGAIPAVFEVGRAAIAGPRSAISGRVDPAGYGERKATQALQRDGRAPSEMLQALDDARAGGAPEMTLADVGGRNTKRRVRDAQNIPGRAAEEANEFLDARQFDAQNRVTKKLESYWGGPQSNIYDEAERLAAERAAKAGPLYEAARAQNPPVDTSSAVAAIDKVISPGGGAAARSSRQPGDLRDGTISGTLRKVREWMTTDAQSRVGLMQLHEVKMDLDGLVAEARSKGNTTLVGRLNEVRSQLLKSMDKASPEYAQARRFYAGESRLMDAVETGRTIFKMDPEEIAGALKGMNTAEQAHFRIGASRAIQDRLGDSDVSSVYAKLTQGQTNKARLRAVIGDDAEFGDFMKFMQNERAQFATRNASQGNSTTAQQGLGVMDAGMDAAVQVGRDVANEGVVRATLNAVGRSLSKLGGWTEESAAETARILLSTDPAVQTRILHQLAQQAQAGAIPAPFVRQVLTMTGAQAGGGGLQGAR